MTSWSFTCCAMADGIIRLMEEIRRSPVDMVNILLFIGFYTCQVVQDFFHQQYHRENGGKTLGMVPAP